MSQELRDLRAKITVETDAVLDSISTVTGRDRSEIVREWLHERALREIAVHTVLDRKLKAEGLKGSAGEQLEMRAKSINDPLERTGTFRTLKP